MSKLERLSSEYALLPIVMMNVILDCPAEIVARLLGNWLTLQQISRLEVAICSDQNRLGLMEIYECLVLKADVVDSSAEHSQQMLDWLTTRKIKVSSMQMSYPLPRIAGTKITALLSHSKQHILKLSIHCAVCALGPLVACISRFCSQIEDLEMRSYRLNRPFFELLSGLQKLKYLRITKCIGLLAEYCNELHCPSVDQIFLDGQISVQAQRALLTMCSNITSCDLYYAQDVDLSTLSMTARKINIFRCSQIVAWNLNENLSILRVYYSGLRDDQVAQVIAQCPKLLHVYVGYNRALSEATIASITDAYKNKLLSFDVSGCDRLTLTGLENIVSACRNLLAIFISDLSGQITQEGLFTAIAQKCPRLRNLTTEGNTLSDEALITISRIKLEWLKMNRTNGYTVRGIMALVKNCVSLVNISIDNALVTDLVKLMWQDKRPLLKFT